MQFWNVREFAEHAHADHEVGRETHPGVVVKRRAILNFGLTAAGLAMIGAAGLSGCASPRGSERRPGGRGVLPNDPGGFISADEFTARMIPEARALIAADAPDEEAYLAAATALLSRVEATPRWRVSPVGQDWTMDTFAYYPPIVLMQIEMAPRSVIRLHDHRHYNGVLLATKGSARCRNFEFAQEERTRYDIASGEVPAKGQDFLIRQTSDTLLRPRQLSTLTRERDNIHQVEAGDEGATLVDFFTHFSPEARSYELEWDGEPYNEESMLFKVSWKS